MMKYFLLKSEKENIRDFVLSENIYTLSYDKILSNISKGIEIQINSTNIKIFDDYIFDNSNEYYDLNLNKFSFKADKEFYFYKYAFKDHILINSEKAFALYNFIEGKIIKKIDHEMYSGSLNYLLNETVGLVFESNSIMYAYDFISEIILWQLDVSTYFDKPPYIYEGRTLVIGDRLVFFVYTRDWKQYATFVLNANTGKILFTTKEMVSKLFEHNQYIYQIQRKVIKQLNPKTLTVQTIDLEEKLKERGLLLVEKSACFYKNKLYVTARESSSDIYNIWLIIDLESETIEHQQEMLLNPKRKVKESNKMFISDIKANDKYVTVRCTNHFYVFEKEEE